MVALTFFSSPQEAEARLVCIMRSYLKENNFSALSGKINWQVPVLLSFFSEQFRHGGGSERLSQV